MGRPLHLRFGRSSSLGKLERTLLALLALLFTPVWAQPSVFPEDAVFASLGYGAGVGVGFETVLPVRYLDVSISTQVYTPVTDLTGAGFRVSGTALLFPAFGTTPPLALGLGADAGYGPDGLGLHAGALLGTDLLFSLRLPMTASLYLAPGYASERGFSLAWAAGLRYYFDAENVAAELLSTDRLPLAVGVRLLF